MEKTVYLDGNSLTLEDVVAICRHGAKVALTEEAKKAIQISRDIVEKNIDLKQVVNTNKCLIHLEKHGDKLLIISCIDNLLKGASGQAVHNMNLMFNLEETVGLRLKPSAF